MAARAAERRVAAEAAEGVRQAEAYARLVGESPPRVEGEDWIVEDGPHRGHWEHAHESHPGHFVCSCGTRGGLFSYGIAITGTEPELEPCPVCIARGIPQAAPG
jgi:hypothetical protein